LPHYRGNFKANWIYLCNVVTLLEFFLA
jgi:hypothetical protein